MPDDTKLNIDEMFDLLYKLKRQREDDGTNNVIEFWVPTYRAKETFKMLRKAGFKNVRMQKGKQPIITAGKCHAPLQKIPTKEVPVSQVPHRKQHRR